MLIDSSVLPGKVFRRWLCSLLILGCMVFYSASGATAPTVTAKTPAAGATDVPVTTTISTTFSDPMDPATITPGSVTLSQAVRIRAVAGGHNYTVALRDNGTVTGWGYNGSGQTTVPNSLVEVIAITAGSNHAVALKNDGTVVAWGGNTSGQSAVPDGLAGVTAVAAGMNFTLALKADGTVIAWGENSGGQTTIPGGLSGITGIAAGASHALALKSDGTVAAWGANASGQTAVPPGLSGVTAVAAGFDHSVALKADGTIVAWGANSYGQLTLPAGLSGVIAISAGSNYTLALKNDGTVIAWGDNSSDQTVIPAGLSGITAIAAGYQHAVVLKDDGTLASWGENSCSQTTLPTGLSGVTTVAAGSSHTVALKNNGTLFAWGYNSNGQSSIPAGLSGVTAVAAGFAHTVALKNDGTVIAWGSNDNGQATVPTGLSGVIAIAAGDYHSVALKNDGTVVVWGLNNSGQATVPGALSGVSKIAAGTSHTVALKQDGTVTVWGSASYNATSIPVGLSGVTAIAAGGYHSVAVKNDGTLLAWGEDTQGQSTIPPGLTGVIAVAAGNAHTVALKSDGTVVAFGADNLGQSSVLAGLSGVVGIAAGSNHTVAVKNDGTLVSWGDNKIAQATVPQDIYSNPVETSISYSTGSNSATLNPVSSLPLAANLTATVTTGVRSLEGIHPLADDSWSFATTAPPITTVSPPGGTYSSPQDVTLTANEPATIYYTTNGSDPNVSSPIYSAPIRFLVSTILKFFAKDTAGNSETPQTATYTMVADITPPVTTASPASGTYSTAQNVTLIANEPATIYYTTNGSDPTISSPPYSGPIRLLVSTILKFFARDTAGNNETVKTESYTIKQNQTVSFAPLPDKTFGDVPFILGATASSGLPVNFTSSNTAVATISGTTVSIVGAGTATITANQSGNDGYNPASTVTQILTVNKALLTVQAVNATRAYGTVNPVFSVIYSGFVNGDTPSVLSGSPLLSTTATPSNSVGTYPITVTAGNLAAANYSFSFVNGTLSIIKADQTINFGALPTKSYGDAPFTLGATASSSLAVSYTSSNSSVATVSGTTVTIVGAGSSTITASQSGDGNYNAAPPIARTLTIIDITPPVTSVSPSAGTYSSAQSVTLTANEPATIYYTTNGNDPTVSSPVYSGPIQILVSAVLKFFGKDTAGNSETVRTAAFTIKQNQTISFAPLPSKTYGDQSFTLSASASSGLPVNFTSSNTAVATISGTTVTIVSAGTATITASQIGNTVYNPAPDVIRTLTVDKANLTVRAIDATRAYGAMNPAFGATFSGFVNGDSIAALSGSPALSTAATPSSAVGTYPITVTAGNLAAANYSFSFVDGALTITKAEQIITFGPLPVKSYGDSSFTLDATSTSGLSIAYMSSNSSVATISGSTLTIVGAGSATITASQVGDGNYNAAPEALQTLTINKAAATITLGSLSARYDGTPKMATATTIPAGLNVTITYDGAATAPTAVASYTIVGTVNDPNYQGSAAGTMTIAKGDQTISFNALPSKTYGDPAFSLSATASTGLAVTFTSSNPAVATVSGATVTIIGAGTATITANQAGNANYNAASAVAQTLTVNKKVATIIFGQLIFTYNNDIPMPVTVTTIPAGLAVTITYDGSPDPPFDVGNYTVVALVVDANYQGTATATEEIARRNQTITFNPLPVKTYGNAAFTLTATASSGLSVTYTSSNTAVATISTTKPYKVTIVGAGTSIITAYQVGNKRWNDAPPVAQTLTVNKADGTVTLGSLSTTYDGSAKAATATTSPSGRTVTFTYNGVATAPTAAGSYSVIGTMNDTNYQGNASGTLTIAKTSQTITFGALPAKSYGNAPFNPNAAASSSLAISYVSSNPAVATVSGITVTIVGVGTTTITASQGGDGNYNAATAVPQTLTVDKGTAAVTLGNLSAIYNGAPMAATATTVPNGLPVTLTYNGSATLPTAAGTYLVTATVTSPNYQGSATGTLTIAKGAQTINFGTLPSKTVGNTPFTITATSSSGLAISFTSSNPAVATISGTTITIVGAGSTTITASQSGDANINAAAPVVQTLTVNAAQPATSNASVTIGSNTVPCDTFSAVIAAITTGSTATVKLQAITFTEAVNFNVSNATVSFNGGYDSGLTNPSGMTTIQGSLTISAGTLIADKLVIR